MAKYKSSFTGEEIDARLSQIADKYGYMRMSSTINEQNYYSLEVFSSKEDAELYDSDPEKYFDKITIITIPISTVQGDAYASLLSTSIKSSAIIVSTKDTLMIPLNFRAVKISQVGNENAGITGTLTIQRRVAGGDWSNAYEISNVLTSNNYTDTNVYQEVDILPALINATQEIRIRASFQYEDIDGSTKTAYSAWVMVGKTITKTTLRLNLSTDYSQPISLYDANNNLKNFVINYIPIGEVTKKLYISVQGEYGTYTTVRETNENGSVIEGCNINVSQNDQYGLLTHGIKYVEAYLEAEDGMGNTIKSNVLSNQFMVATDENNTSPYLLLQNVVEDAVNYMQSDICEYAIYSPYDEKVKIAILMTGYTNDYESDTPEEYFRLEQEIEPRKQQSLSATVEIETESTEDSFAYLRVRRLTDTTNTDFIKESTDGKISSYTITVDNKNAFTPVAGSTFLLNPKVRSNNENNPARIINSRNNNAEVESTFEGFGFITDGWIDVGSQRALRVPAGGKLTIKRNLWRSFLTNPDTQLNFEIDFAVHNITNTTDPIISIAEDTETGFKGLRLNATDGWIKSKSYNVSDDCLFSWEEDSRNHVFVNIENMVQPQGPDVTYNGDYNAIPDPTDSSKLITRKPIARIFLNGCLQREIPFNISDVNEWTEKGCDIVIGNVGCDIDIYSIRAYEAENRNITPRTILMRNYLSTLTTSEEKRNIFERNNITDNNGRISLEAAKALGLNCMVWHGVLPSKINDGEYKGWYEYFRYDEDRQLMKEYSGTNCKASGLDNSITADDKPLTGKAQGTTAKTYYDHNIQDDNSKVKTTINVAIEDFHESISVSEPYNKDGVMYVDICGGNLGKNFPVEEKTKPYKYLNGYVTVPDGWIDANGKYRGMGYMVSPDTALAQKKVIKINYASSMQSHLLGACKTYDLLHRKVVGNTPLQDRVPTAVSAKHTEPFLLFHEINGNTYYKGLGNYGAAKMDKVAWGYAKSLHPNFALIEGSDNNMTLTDFRVPFDKNTAVYNCKEEYWEYNGSGSFDFDGGATVGYTGDEDSILKQMSEGWQFKNYDADSEAPSANIRDRWAFVCNYIYLHSTNLKYHNGTYSSFIATFNAATDAQKAEYLASKMWFAVDDGDYKAYNLYRYDALTKSWIDAGLLGGNNTYHAIDLRTNSMTKMAYEANKGNFDNMNNAFKASIAEHMHNTIKYVINEDSLVFNYCYVLSFLAGTDNSSKNTYYKIMPIEKAFVADSEFNTWYKEMFITTDDFNFSFVYQVYLDGDDMDSIFRTNNNSHQTKPYYIERRFPYADDKPDECLYEGMRNQLFNYVEEYAKLYPNTLQLMLNKILTAATDLVDDNDTLYGLKSNKKSAWGFLHKYFFNTQYYFPQICYNEQARIRYEFPHMIGYVSSGSGARSIQPISQSLGSQLENELQYMRQRLVYMASYARYSALAGAAGTLGLTDNTPSLSFTGSGMQYKFVLKSYQYIYPTFNSGSSKIEVDKRLKPDEAFEYILYTGGETGDAGIGLYGIDYYTSIGNVGDFAATNATFIIQGKRLREFIAEPTKGAPFAPQQINVKASQLDTFSIKGCIGIEGSLDLSTLTRCRNIDLSGTKLYEVNVPSSAPLKSVLLGDSIQRLVLENTPNLQILSFEGFNFISEISIGVNVGNLKIQPLITTLYNSKKATGSIPIRKLKLSKINFKDVTSDLLSWLANIESISMEGAIYMLAKEDVGFSLKIKLLNIFGNIDDTTNKLYVDYEKHTVNDVNLRGLYYHYHPEEYDTMTFPLKQQFELTPLTQKENDFIDITYSINPYEFPTSNVSMDAKTGELTINYLSDLESKYVVTGTLTRSDGSTISKSKIIECYKREARKGDFVYYDGTFGDGSYYNNGIDKTVVGVCFFVAPRGDDGNIDKRYFNVNDVQKCLMVALEDLKTLKSYQPSIMALKPQRELTTFSNTYIAADGSTKKEFIRLRDFPTDIYVVGEIVRSLWQHSGYNCTDANVRSGSNENDGFFQYERKYAASRGFYHPDEDVSLRKISTDDLGIGKEAWMNLAIEAGFKDGDVINEALVQTYKGIALRNLVMTNQLIGIDSGYNIMDEETTQKLASYIPAPTDTRTEYENLILNMETVYNMLVNVGLNTYVARQILYPAFSAAYAYAPKVDGLSDKFKAHRWFLPSAGIGVRLVWESAPNAAYPYSGSGISKTSTIFDMAISKGVMSKFTCEIGNHTTTENIIYQHYFSNHLTAIVKPNYSNVEAGVRPICSF